MIILGFRDFKITFFFISQKPQNRIYKINLKKILTINKIFKNTLIFTSPNHVNKRSTKIKMLSDFSRVSHLLKNCISLTKISKFLRFFTNIFEPFIILIFAVFGKFSQFLLDLKF